MNNLRMPIGIACRHSKEFMDMLTVYLGHHLGLNIGKDFNCTYNYGTYTTTLEIHLHFLREGRLRGLLPDVLVHGTMKLILDNGWDWIQVDLDNLSKKDISVHILCIENFITEVKETNPEMFIEFDPSERYD